jgi:hypothetical protein
MTTRIRTLWLLPLVLLAAGGCGGKSAPPGVDPAQLLRDSVARFQQVKSFHFKLEHEKGSIPIVLNLGLVSAEGDVVVPDKLQADVEAKAAGTTVRVKVVGIGDKTWITNPFTRQFQSLGGVSVNDIVDPAGIVRAVASSLKDVKVEGEDSVDGVKAYHLSGTLMSDALTNSLTFADSGRTLKVDAWLGKDDALLRRAQLKGALAPDESADVVRTITLSKFDAPVTIEAPQ